MRYAEWCTAAPSLEADIAAAAMGLDDIGHSRVLYGSLRELGSAEVVAGEATEYSNVAYLDRPWTEWAQFVAANAVLDGAFSLMIEALAGGNVEVLRSRLKKMLQEEQYHYLHGRSWMRETNAGGGGERGMGRSACLDRPGGWRRRPAARVRGSLQWACPDDSEAARGDGLRGSRRRCRSTGRPGTRQPPNEGRRHRPADAGHAAGAGGKTVHARRWIGPTPCPALPTGGGRKRSPRKPGRKGDSAPSAARATSR